MSLQLSHSGATTDLDEVVCNHILQVYLIVVCSGNHIVQSWNGPVQ